MGIESLSLILDICLLGMAAYIYAYASGILNIKDKELRKRQTEVMKTSGKWMRPVSLGLGAITLVNLFARFVG